AAESSRSAAKATPSAPAAPSAGAPRTASRWMAPISSSTVSRRRVVHDSGSAHWSMITIALSDQSMVRGNGSVMLFAFVQPPAQLGNLFGKSADMFVEREHLFLQVLDPRVQTARAARAFRAGLAQYPVAK